MNTRDKSSRDELDDIIATQLRPLRPIAETLAIPAPTKDEPSDDELLLLLDGRLQPSEARALEARLGEHAFSLGRLKILREVFAETAQNPKTSEDSALARATTASDRASTESPKRPPMARLVFAIHRGAHQMLSFVRGTDTPLPLTPAILPTRSTKRTDGVTMTQETAQTQDTLYRFARDFGDCNAAIDIEHLPGRGIDVRVELSEAGVPLGNARASLRRHGKLLESLRIREGRADFVNLEPRETYEMELQRAGEVLGEISLAFLEC
ncbi:MAG: hypothetical protein KAI47_23440 [Deltaproteobacteria bacterium]|nr:hypothetical protein [Deltaproteobacteria bacterium]